MPRRMEVSIPAWDSIRPTRHGNMDVTLGLGQAADSPHTSCSSHAMTACSRYCLIMLSALLATLGSLSFGDESLLREQGRSVFTTRCAKCHAADGRGVAERDVEPLGGNATIDELIEVIRDTMPDDDPDACTGKDAIAVAAYIHSEFYSKSPSQPRVQLARLTATQLRQSMADLHARFVGVARLSDSRGLRGEYYDGSRPRRDKRRIERIDATVDFDFADKGPGSNISAQDFSIQWNGGLKVDVTGRYEVIIRSTCAFVCYLGSYEHQLINNHVQSGDKTEFRRSLVLTAGRVYPLKIEFYQRKRKTEQPPAKISLSWVPPYATEQIIPARHLVSDNVHSLCRPSFHQTIAVTATNEELPSIDSGTARRLPRPLSSPSLPLPNFGRVTIETAG